MTMTQEKLSSDKYFSSSDLALVTAISLHFPIDAIDRRNPYKAYFLFKRDEDLDRLINSYYRGERQEDPIKYFQQLKIIKARLYETR